MATKQTCKTISNEQAREWLDGYGHIDTNLPTGAEVLQLLGSDYSQHDLVRQGREFVLTSTTLV